jgi:hypothetical protein
MPQNTHALLNTALFTGKPPLACHINSLLRFSEQSSKTTKREVQSIRELYQYLGRITKATQEKRRPTQ